MVENNNTRTNLFDINSLFEFSRIVNSSSDLNFTLNHFLLTAMGKLLCSKGIIYLKREGKGYKAVSGRGIDIKNLPVIEINKNFKKVIQQNFPETKKYFQFKYLPLNDINLVVPLVSQDNLVGLAAFNRLVPKKLNANEYAYLQSLSNVATVAVEQKLMIDELKALNKELDRNIHQMNTLFDLSRGLNIIKDRDKIIRLVTLSLLGQMGVSKYFICINENDKMEIIVSGLDKKIGKKSVKNYCNIEVPMITRDIRDKKSRNELERLGIEVIVPMKLQNITKGIFALGKKMSNLSYTSSDLEFLFLLGNLAIISLENVRLFKEELEKQKMEDDLLIAREIQRGLLPKIFPFYKNIEISAINIPSKQVGGDYYDIIECGENKFISAVADVSGKGTPASLLMANLQAMIRALVPVGLKLSELTKRVNDLIFASTTDDRFITFFWCCIDTVQRTINYVNAGHNPPFLFRKNGKVERFETGGMICGVMKTVIPYEEALVKYSKGDILILFTDGVSEAMDIENNEFGEERIISVVKKNRNKSAKTIMNNLVDSVIKYSGSGQYDDITLVVIKF